MKTFLNPILKVKTFYIKTLCSFFLRRRDKNCDRRIRKRKSERGGGKMRKIERVRVRERDKRRKRNKNTENEKRKRQIFVKK